MTRFIIVTALFFAALAAVGIFAISAHSTDRVAEDSPASSGAVWDCRTMGNGVCGPIRHDPRFRQFDLAFSCFAEVSYTHPKMPWNDRVMRCIPPVRP